MNNFHKSSIILITSLSIYFLTACSGYKVKPILTTQSPTQFQETQPTPTTPLTGGTKRLRDLDGMTLIYIPAGKFLMGSTDVQVSDALELCREQYPFCNSWYYEREYPIHEVSLEGFWIDQAEVSNAQYQLCLDTGNCSSPTICNKGETTIADPTKADHPVVCVNWEEAQEYCQWVGARLPTEAEWEYAFRGENSTTYPWGNEFDGSLLNFCDVNCTESFANIEYDDGFSQTSPVDSYPVGANWAGVLNFAGNVSEWVQDWFGEYHPDPSSNPVGPDNGDEKMIKGCSWFSPPVYCRGAQRPSVSPETRFDYLGFRCAMSPED